MVPEAERDHYDRYSYALDRKVQNSRAKLLRFCYLQPGEGLEYHPSAPDSNLTSGKVKYNLFTYIWHSIEKNSDSAFG